MLFSTTTVVELNPGSLVARPEDVVHRTPTGVLSIEFDGSAEGLPDGTNVDAVTRMASGDLVLSVDRTVLLPPSLVVDDDDLVRFDGASFSLLFDASAVGFDERLDVDALDEVATDRFLISLDASGAAGGVDFDDEDLLEIDIGGGSVVGLAFDGSGQHADWRRVDLDAVNVPEPAMGLLFGIIGLVGLARSRHGVLRAPA